MTGASNADILKHVVIELLKQIQFNVIGLKGFGVLRPRPCVSPPSMPRVGATPHCLAQATFWHSRTDAYGLQFSPSPELPPTWSEMVG